jgi:hypothetical protein
MPRYNWSTFTRRTNNPKLAWLEYQLDLQAIPHRRRGQSAHAPILEVPDVFLDAAWDILLPVDDVPDDAQIYQDFWQQYHSAEEYL